MLFDKFQKKIVNNESSEIIRMLNTEFNAFCETVEQKEIDLYPKELQKEIDEINEWVYPYVTYVINYLHNFYSNILNL